MMRRHGDKTDRALAAGVACLFGAGFVLLFGWPFLFGGCQ